MALKDIIGQEKALNILRGCVRKGRIPHALLFAGDDGIGKKLTAINFAKTLNCLNVENSDSSVKSDGLFEETELQTPNSKPQIDACDQCPSCKKIEKGNHPDVFIVGPEGDGDQIKVDAIRQLEESLSYKPFEGEYKIAIIDNAEKMNQSTANAFLATLESPPAHSILIMVSSRPEMLLSTIRSRCQRINFSPLPVEVMGKLLEERLKGLGHEQAMLLSILSGGKLGYALDEDLIEARDRSFDEFKDMLVNPETEVWEDKGSMERWFDWAQLLLRDAAVFRATGRTDLLINQDKENEIKEMSKKAALKDILKLAGELHRIRRLLNFNLNKQLTLNHTSLLLRKTLGGTAYKNS
ncbi:MAG: DNA polymerase III subunit delta' [Nitrospirae bacterium]|nr:DNA polymerase III subunit delta' [Nitrospirota bacterium]